VSRLSFNGGYATGVIFYRTFSNVPKGADLTIFCFLAALERWRRERGRDEFPEEIYLQVDGGSENANQYVLALCELLVHKRIARLIVLTRLPTGHTHEDIDAAFGHLWRFLRLRSIITVEQFKEDVEKHFKDKKLQASVQDVYIIPDYQKFLRGCIDPKLSGYAKLEKTQHRWQFEAVDKSAHFPQGCKVTYRAYASDRVIEIQQRAKTECMSPIEQLTGMEPVLTHVVTHPAAGSIPGRPGIEGFHLLRAVPFINSRKGWSPMAFHQDTAEINATMSAVRIKWPSGPTRESWEDWYRRFSPGAVTADVYAATRPELYVIPLLPYLRQDILCEPMWSGALSTSTVSECLFTIPVVLAVSMPCVETSYTPAGGPARHYATADAVVDEVLKRHDERTTEYYGVSLYALGPEPLRAMLRQRAWQPGQIGPGTNRKALIIRIKAADRNTLERMYRTLMPALDDYVQSRVQSTLTSEAEANKVAVDFTWISSVHRITMRDLQVFRQGALLSTKVVDCVLAMMQMRDDVKNQHSVDQPKRRTLFLPTRVWREGVCDAAALHEILLHYGGTAAEVSIVHVVEQPSPARGSWSVLTLDFRHQSCEAYSSDRPEAPPPLPAELARAKDWYSRVKEAFGEVPAHPFTTEWPHPTLVTPTAQQKYDVDQTDFDSGFYMLTYLTYRYHGLPLVFNSIDLPIFRKNLCLGVLDTILP
jgi:hypothetical protein